MRNFGLYLFLSLILCSCSGADDQIKSGVLVECQGKELTRVELLEAIGRGLSKEDSTRFADKYIRDWINENLMYRNAKANIDNLDQIEKQIQEYRRRLVIYEYEKQLVQEKLSRDISDEEIRLFLDSHRSMFVLKEPILQGLFLKIPANAPGLSQLKAKLYKFTPESLELIEKYSLQNGMVYEYFFDRWIELSKIMDNIPYKMINGNSYLRTHQYLEVTEGDFWYFLYFKDYSLEGSDQPFEYAKPKVLEYMLMLKRKSFFTTMQQQLFEKAVNDKELRFHELEPSALQ